MAGDGQGGGPGWWPDDGEEGSPRERAGKDERAEGPPAPRPPRPPRGLESRERPKAASRYSTYVGLAFLVLVVVAIVNAINSDDSGILGATDRRGEPLAEFAVPDALSGIEADANIAQDDCESSRNPCPADEVREPACEVEAEGALRVCDLFDKPLAISFWFTRGGDCLPTQDAFDDAAARRGRQFNFLSVNVLDDATDVAGIVRERGWKVPVGHDRDGAVSNLFGVGVCPTILLAYPGGILHDAEIRPGNFNAAEIDAMLDELLVASRRREPRSGRG